MWWDRNAWWPVPRQNVFFSSAPQASTGRGAGSSGRRERLRGVAARAPHGIGGPRTDAHHRVVGADVDRAVVDQERVGDAGEPLAGVVVAVGDRLVGDVAAGQHERRADARGTSRWCSGV